MKKKKKKCMVDWMKLNRTETSLNFPNRSTLQVALRAVWKRKIEKSWALWRVKCECRKSNDCHVGPTNFYKYILIKVISVHGRRSHIIYDGLPIHRTKVINTITIEELSTKRYLVHPVPCEGSSSQKHSKEDTWYMWTWRDGSKFPTFPSILCMYVYIIFYYFFNSLDYFE